MKKIYLFLSLACFVMFSACSSDDDQIIQETEIVPEGEKVIIGVGMPVSDDTRVSTEDLKNLLWESGDVLTCVGYSADGMKIFGTSEFKLISGEGTATGVFEGNSIKDAAKHKFIYKGKDVQFSHTMWGETTTVDYFNQVQTTPSSSACIKNCLHIETGMVDLKTFKGNLPTTIMNSVLRLNIKSLPDVIKDANKFVIDLNFDKYGDSRIANLTYNGTIVPEVANYLFMSIDPQLGLPANSIMRFDITANDQTVKASYDVTTGKNYEPGKIYKLLLDYNNPGSWKWDVPTVGLTTIYEGNFKDGPQWTEENSIQDVDLWNFAEYLDKQQTLNTPNLLFDGYKVPVDITETISTRVISPSITLKTNNTISFNYFVEGDLYMYFTQQAIRDNFKLWIRESGTTEWFAVPSFSFTNEWYNTGAHITTGDLDLPVEYEGKTIELSFTTISKQYQDGYDIINGYRTAIWNLLISGK